MPKLVSLPQSQNLNLLLHFEFCLTLLGSIPSLGMGLLFGSLIGLGAYQTSHNPNNYYLALGTSVALAGFMGKRYLDSGKVMPAGLIAAIRYKKYIK